MALFDAGVGIGVVELLPERRDARLGISSYRVTPAALDALVAAVEQNAPPQAGPAPFMAMSAAA